MIGLNIVKINIPNSLQKNIFLTLLLTHNIYNGRSCLPDKKYMYTCTFSVKKLTMPVNFSM